MNGSDLKTQTLGMRSIQIKPTIQSKQILKPNQVDFQAQQIKPLFSQQFKRYLTLECPKIQQAQSNVSKAQKLSLKIRITVHYFELIIIIIIHKVK